MRALTIRQPPASLLVEGIKPAETRSWMAPLQHWGTTIGIHAGKHRIALDELNAETRVAAARWLDPEGECSYDLPMGAVIATATLRECVQVVGHERREDGTDYAEVLFPDEGVVGCLPIDGFGDYSIDRWIWLFSDMVKLAEPIPARGHQGLWEWREAA